jgi:aminoglycoside/choline kinase family phosphotransferase
MDMSRAGILETGLAEFIKVDEFLNNNDIKAPQIYAHDLDQGLALIEYLGDTSFGDALKQGTDAETLYGAATDILIQIRKADSTNNLKLNGYKDTLIWKRVPQFVDYYMPLAVGDGVGRLTTQADHDAFQQVWNDIEVALPSCPMSVCLGDYHLENLIWRPDATPPYGVIDFQDAFWSPQPYDLLNLLEDARVSVPQNIKDQMMAQYCADMDATERQIFKDWYVVMSAQFHCRVIGLFVKFARENSGVEFLAHIPRLQAYIINNLKNPVLKPLKDWLEGHKVSFEINVK